MIDRMTLVQLVQTIKQRDIKVAEVVQIYLKRISKHSHLNAFIHLDEEEVLSEAGRIDQRIASGDLTGDLLGVPLVVKDNIHVAGMPCSGGTVALKKFYPREDAPVIKSLREAGAMIVGKTNMHELAFGITGYNYAFYDQQVGVRNTFNQDKFAGGSSSGSGVAVGAKLAAAALGSDTGGSGRIPAALNGIAGFRPTIGRYSPLGLIPISHSRDTITPMANKVEDIILLDQVISSSSIQAQPVKIRLGFDESNALAQSTEVVKLMWQKVKHILNDQANIELVAVDLSKVYELNTKVSFPIALFEVYDNMVQYLNRYQPDLSLPKLVEKILSPDVKDIYENLVLARKIPTPDGSLVDIEPVYQEAIKEHRPLLIQAYQDVFSTHQLNAILSPTTPSEAMDAVPETTNFEIFSLFIQNTDPTTNAGFPSISIPAWEKDGVALGVQLDGLANRDETLLSVAQAIEPLLNEVKN